MNKIYLFMIMFTTIVFVLGCELGEHQSAPETQAVPATQAATTPTDNTSTPANNEFNFGAVAWLGPAYPGTARDARANLHSASISRSANQITLSYDPLPADWPKQVNAPGQLVMFEQLGDGSWRGGRVEWLDPGQSVKSLNNINNGYNGWRLPPAGARMAIVILSADGRLGSNVVYANY